MQNLSNSLITFDTQLKTALRDSCLNCSDKCEDYFYLSSLEVKALHLYGVEPVVAFDYSTITQLRTVPTN